MKPFTHNRKQKGAFLVLFAVLLPVFLLLVALVSEIGRVWAYHTKLQNAADAAALAGAANFVNGDTIDSHPNADLFADRYVTANFGGLVLIWGFLLFGAMLPFGVLNHIIRDRQTKIIRQLPDVLDLLSISVQAGLSLDGAMRKVVERMEGPLIDEFRRMLRDIRMGMTRRRSMQLMAKRCDVQDVYLFVMSVVQSERLGASMSDTLVIQADNMRDLRRQRARTQAMKAPVKMIFPLVFCIFPAIFVVVLLPSLISLMQGMK